MKLRRAPPRAPTETIVAMIDVVFFLLVFFMLIGRLDATAPFEVLPPLGRTGTDLPGGGAMVAVAADGRLALNGVGMTADTLVATLTRLAADDPALSVRVNAHQAAPLSAVLPLLGQFEDMGLRSVVLIVSPNPP